MAGTDEEATLAEIEDWPAFCQQLQVTLARAGNPSLRELEKRAGRQQLLLPRSTMSRVLAGARPTKPHLDNFLIVLGLDEPTRRLWAETWERVTVSAYSNRAAGLSSLEVETPTDQTLPAELIEEAVADIVDTVKVVTTSFVGELRSELAGEIAKLSAGWEALKEKEIALADEMATTRAEVLQLREVAAQQSQQMTNDSQLLRERILEESRREAKEIMTIAHDAATKTLSEAELEAKRTRDAAKAAASDIYEQAVKDGYEAFTSRASRKPKEEAVVARGDNMRSPAGFPADPNGKALKLEVGDHVNHEKYGPGIVLAKDGSGARTTVTIDFFQEKGPVRLMLIGGIPLQKVKPSANGYQLGTGRTLSAGEYVHLPRQGYGKVVQVEPNDVNPFIVIDFNDNEEPKKFPIYTPMRKLTEDESPF